jgi:hypothetical protein
VIVCMDMWCKKKIFIEMLLQTYFDHSFKDLLKQVLLHLYNQCIFTVHMLPNIVCFQTCLSKKTKNVPMDDHWKGCQQLAQHVQSVFSPKWIIKFRTNWTWNVRAKSMVPRKKTFLKTNHQFTRNVTQRTYKKPHTQ